MVGGGRGGAGWKQWRSDRLPFQAPSWLMGEEYVQWWIPVSVLCVRGAVQSQGAHSRALSKCMNDWDNWASISKTKKKTEEKDLTYPTSYCKKTKNKTQKNPHSKTNHSFKCEIQTYKLLEATRESICDFGLSKECSDIKNIICERTLLIRKWPSSLLKTSALQKTVEM